MVSDVSHKWAQARRGRFRGGSRPSLSLDRGWLTSRGGGVTKDIEIHNEIGVEGTAEHHLSVERNCTPSESFVLELQAGVRLLEDISLSGVDPRVICGLQAAKIRSVDHLGSGYILYHFHPLFTEEVEVPGDPALQCLRHISI